MKDLHDNILPEPERYGLVFENGRWIVLKVTYRWGQAPVMECYSPYGPVFNNYEWPIYRAWRNNVCMTVLENLDEQVKWLLAHNIEYLIFNQVNSPP